jgi:hypothetical protein
MEEFRVIEEYPAYKVSNLGRIKNPYGRIIKGKFIEGYKHVELRDESGAKHKRVHRLVAKAFIPNPENKEQVNHINGDKSDNRVENLEWVTNFENRLHAVKTGLVPPECLGIKVVNKATGVIYNTIHEAERLSGVPRKVISYHLSAKCRKPKWQKVIEEQPLL